MSARLLLKGGRVVDPAQRIDDDPRRAALRGRHRGGGSAGGRPRGPGGRRQGPCGLPRLHRPARAPARARARRQGDDPHGHPRRRRGRLHRGLRDAQHRPRERPRRHHPLASSRRRGRRRSPGCTPSGPSPAASRGEELAEFGDLRDAGCVAVSDDGRPVASARMMRRALEYAKAFDLTVIDHCEEPTLTRAGGDERGAGVDPARPAGRARRGRVHRGRAGRPARRAHGRPRCTSPTSRPRPRWTRSAGPRPGACASPPR